MGLAPISDRLAERLVPGLRARMQRVRFVTATAVGALACEPLREEIPSDDITPPAICFEWLLIEAYVRRLSPQQNPRGVPGSRKARAVINHGQRLSAATYLKSPSAFGFSGVYKAFSVDSGVTGPDLEPGPQCAELVRSWEAEAFPGFVDEVPGSKGARFRAQIRGQVRDALRAGRCTTSPGSWIFGWLATSLHPDRPGAEERGILRSMLTDDEHPTRSELARKLDQLAGDGTERELLGSVRSSCSPDLQRIIDAVDAYERFAELVDVAFRTLCSVSHSMGPQPLTAQQIVQHETMVRCARELPNRFEIAAERMTAIGAEFGLEERFGDFLLDRSPDELFEHLLKHHEQVQAKKPPHGKRPWFDPLRNGWVIRAPYGTAEQPELGTAFIHPVRVTALRQFLQETRP